MMATLTRILLAMHVCTRCNTTFRLFKSRGSGWAVVTTAPDFGSEDLVYIDDYLNAYAEWKKLSDCGCVEVPA